MSVSRFGEKGSSGGTFWRESGRSEGKPKGDKGWMRLFCAEKISVGKKLKLCKRTRGGSGLFV